MVDDGYGAITHLRRALSMLDSERVHQPQRWGYATLPVATLENVRARIQYAVVLLQEVSQGSHGPVLPDVQRALD